jgi:hypothetical protein
VNLRLKEIYTYNQYVGKVFRLANKLSTVGHVLVYEDVADSRHTLVYQVTSNQFDSSNIGDIKEVDAVFDEEGNVIEYSDEKLKQSIKNIKLMTITSVILMIIIVVQLVGDFNFA